MIIEQVIGGRDQTMRAYAVGFAAAYLSLAVAFAAPPTAQPTLAITAPPYFADVDASASLAVLDRSATTAVVD